MCGFPDYEPEDDHRSSWGPMTDYAPLPSEPKKTRRRGSIHTADILWILLIIAAVVGFLRLALYCKGDLHKNPAAAQYSQPELGWRVVHEGVICKKYRDKDGLGRDVLVLVFYDNASFPIPLGDLQTKKCIPGWVGQLQSYDNRYYRLVPIGACVPEKVKR